MKKIYISLAKISLPALRLMNICLTLICIAALVLLSLVGQEYMVSPRSALLMYSSFVEYIMMSISLLTAGAFVLDRAVKEQGD